MSEAATRISPRDRDAILQALRSGVVPRRGLQHVQVARSGEIGALVGDMKRIADGGSAIRFVIGHYGSGKSFLLSLTKAIAHKEGLVTLSADLNPDRRLYGGSGQARSLYQELARNVATLTSPDGGAMASVLERFVTSAMQQSKKTGEPVSAIIQDRLSRLSSLVNGFDFATVVERYAAGADQGNDRLKSDAIRWMRGEFTTKTDARNALGVRTMIDDDDFYDQLKLFAAFVREAGYAGAVVAMDELVNVYKIPSSVGRAGNYEQVLRILNDVLQGSAEGIGFIFGGTPETLSDARRGLFSYQALQSRLQENSFAAQHGRTDFSGPVIRLANLSPEDVYVLLGNLRRVFASGTDMPPLPDEALTAFLNHCNSRIGAAYFQTPRTTIRAFIDMLSVLDQHRDLAWEDLIEKIDVAADEDVDQLDDPDAPDEETAAPATGDDELASFRL